MRATEIFLRVNLESILNYDTILDQLQ